MIRLGAYSEFGFADPYSESLRDAIDHDMSPSLRRRVSFYLVQGPILTFTMERRPDVFDGEEVFLSAGLRTDGRWYWRADLAHYVAKYGLRLPAEFLEFAASNAWFPPELAAEELAVLAAQIRQ